MTKHLITRKKEHMRPKEVWMKHIRECGSSGGKKLEAQILKISCRRMIYLNILETLLIRDLNPVLNTNDEYIHRPLPAGIRALEKKFKEKFCKWR